MSIDLKKLTPAPWAWDDDESGWGGLARICLNGPESPVLMGAGEHTNGVIVIQNAADAEFITLSRSDLDVKLRRGWSTHKDGDYWVVPELINELIVLGVQKAITRQKLASGRSVARQFGHDVGLLTQADRWYREHME